MHRGFGMAMIGAAALLGGCATTNAVAPVDVTRYHLGSAIASETIRVQPMTGYAGISPEDQTYTGAVAGALARAGFAPVDAETSIYIAAVSYKRTSQGVVRKRPPITIGLGTGTGSYGRRGGTEVGVGGSFGIGGGRAELIATELSVQIKRRSDTSIVWEGRAITEALNQGDEPITTPQRLANALFKGFPGESGITITVK